ncbi:adenosylmethionine--8-amino-7-oxononanoate transaminase [Campylobacter hyointestinalis]|uniref:Adenosylmethionine-8-amino-7-oxononanoate aminotransferase n=1 Tax=Campylobacter hyointestinalis subsp. lawsonii TaxID=91353 RepID=A0AAV6EEY9_CAMHY|nr:adenosylmethionine--8-amino-7-oxononanoate transaminase [Campylobacter hyointestinalis]KAB0613180.1 adenosylmethionine--8-amino-7-oxononanoate transaminase [Campylobacter hyointestinalis subsp. lawsonii]QKF69226.1 adenosylmethionine--8-amino-7-oxononanoate aminotransferase [Campylobacter hyointestinalis subsp. lawsonii]RAZ29580.1 adenosylmethionine--8-amino-7-oxononanoate transaminase [Campylobacter hyointestinalis subsp. lawsonii]
MTNLELSKLDLEHIWHPCTQMSDHENFPIIPIKSGKKAVLSDFDGNEYIDCVSSWWVNIFGHSNEYISAKLSEQAMNLEHVIMAGFSHEGIIKFSNRLINLLPKPLNKCFYGDNGSSAIEIALKMSYHKNLLLGKNKPLFLNLKNSYHGETIAALSVGDVELYKKIYKNILIKTIQTKVPMNFKGMEVSDEEALYDLKNVLENHHEQLSAFILEPLVQCAGDMNMYSADFVKKAYALAKSYDVDIIFDEVAVGFGRTGSLFALELCDVVPDFLCLSKGITGGYLPLSVVVTSDRIYNEFYGTYESNKAFLHSHSYTGNALACACANATLDIFEKENVIEKNRELSKFIKSEFSKLLKYDFIDNFRQTGMILAFDLVGFKQKRMGHLIYKQALQKGLLLRPLANTIYFMPPYVITKEQICYVVSVLDELLSKFR